VKKAAKLKATKKRNGRFMVRKRGGGLVNGADKVAFLQEAGKIKKLNAKKKEEAPAT
jgi:hypothetical protein